MLVLISSVISRSADVLRCAESHVVSSGFCLKCVSFLDGHQASLARRRTHKLFGLHGSLVLSSHDATALTGNQTRRHRIS